MSTIYIPAAIWILGAAACYILAKKRGIKTNTLLDILFCLLGPLAIPYVLLAKPTS